MIPSRIRQIWADGKVAVNGWLSIPSITSAEIMAHAGFDSITVDMQHGMSDYSDLVPMLTAITGTKSMPMVRVPWLEEGIIMRSLDAGAYGVICPMVNTQAEAERFARAMRYPPRGSRSYGPFRPVIFSGPDYPAKANDEILAIAMIETAEAVDNLDAILSVDGIDAIYIGPSDLANSLGRPPGLDQEDKVVTDAIAHILAKAKEHKVRAGLHNGSGSYARRMADMGFDYVTIQSDARMMSVGVKIGLAEYAGGKAEAEKGGSY